MDILNEWLSPYKGYLSTAPFLEAMEAASTLPKGAKSGSVQDAFEAALRPLNEINFSARIWTEYFAAEQPLESVEASPSEAREFILKRLRSTDHVPGSMVSTLGEACFRLGHYRQAEISIAVAYLAGDRSPGTLTLLFGMALRTNRLAEADEALRLIAKSDTALPEVGFCEAIRALHQGDAEGGISRLTALVDKTPGYRPAWRLLLDALAATAQWDSVVRLRKKVTTHCPNDPNIWRRLATAYRTLGKREKALEALRSGLRILDDSVGVEDETVIGLNLESARLHEEMGNQKEALQVYRSLLDRGYSSPAVFLNTASCLKASGQVDESLSLLRGGLRAFENDPDLLSNLGEVLFERGQDEEAFSCLQQAAEQAPGRAGNLVLMATLCLRNRRPEAAIELAEAIARTEPTRSAEAFVIMGDAYHFQGADAAALKAYEAALDAKPESVEIRERIAAAKKM